MVECLYGVDTSDNDFKTVEKTGGEKTHTMTIAELVEHDHSVSIVAIGQGSYGYNVSSLPIGSAQNEKTDSVGGGQPFNIIQPYITCYMWKRTA